MNTFNELNQKLFLVEILNSFKEKNIGLNDCNYVSSSTVKIITKFGDTISVIKEDEKITWKLNSLSMGEVFGKSIASVAGDYLFEISK